MKTKLALITLVAAASLAFVLLSPPRKWHSVDLPRNFTIGMATGENSLASSFTQQAAQGSVLPWNAAIDADSSWSGPAAPFTTTVSTTLGNVGFVNNGTNTISWEDPQNSLPAGVLAATTTGYYTTGSTETVNGTAFFKYTDTDVVGNNGIDFTSFADADANGANGSQYDLDSILVHEVGHALGLGHSSVGPATMYASIGTNDWKVRTLDDDDVNGSRVVYVNGYHSTTFPAGTQLVCDWTFLGLSTATFKNNSKVYVRIQVVDEYGQAVSGASVSISVTRPDATVGTGTASTASSGMVTFDSGKAQHGAYSVTVTSVTKSGMSFNAGAGKSSDTCTF